MSSGCVSAFTADSYFDPAFILNHYFFIPFQKQVRDRIVNQDTGGARSL